MFYERLNLHNVITRLPTQVGEGGNVIICVFVCGVVCVCVCVCACVCVHVTKSVSCAVADLFRSWIV